MALDARTGAIRARARVSEPGVVALEHDEVWVDTSNGLITLDAHLTVRTIFPHQGDGSDEDLAATDDSVWVRTRGGVLWRIDRVRKTVTEKITPSPTISAGSLLITADGIWVSGGNEGIVFRLRS